MAPRRLLSLYVALVLAGCGTEEGRPVDLDTGVDTDSNDTDVIDGTTPDTSVDDSPDGSPDDSGDGDTSAPTDGPTWPAPELVKAGAAGKLLLRGMVVTPDDAFAGEVLVDGNLITCVATTCATSPGATEASIVKTNGLIFPGLIDTHNHVLFDIFDETDWAPTKAYDHHDSWPAEARYKAMVDTKQWLNGETTGSPVSLGCEMLKFGELKALVAGTTSMIGHSGTGKKCFGSLTRSLDTKYDGGLSTADTMRVATIFPSKTTAQGVCDDFGATPSPLDAYVIHVGEGTNDSARTELGTLGGLTTPVDCLLHPKTTVVHGTAFLDAEFTKLAAKSMSLSWSPRSNVFLYGGGTDYTKTTNVPLALSKGINVAVSPDWSMGGSQNMLDELRFADLVDAKAWGDKLTPKMLVQMATINAAKAAHREAVIGSIAVGKRADLVVIPGDTSKPYDALLAARPRDVQLVLVDGVALYGNPVLKSLAPDKPGCETIDVCTVSKFICVATTTTTDKLDQTLSTITSVLGTALSDYDAKALTSYKFAPLTPLVRCP